MDTTTQPLKDTGMKIEEEGMKMDLVCGMELSKEGVKFTSEYRGKPYYFCSRGCKTHFDNDPEKYAD